MLLLLGLITRLAASHILPSHWLVLIPTNANQVKDARRKCHKNVTAL